MSTVESEANNEFFAQFLEDYFAECDEHLSAVRSGLLALDSFVHQSRIDRSLLDDLFRSFHSLKGISGMVGVREAEQLSHEMESYLRELRQEQLFLTPEGMDALIASTKMLEQVISARRAQTPPPNITLVMAQLSACIFDTRSRDKDFASEKDTAAEKDSTSEKASRADLPARETGESAKTWRFEFTPLPALAERGINVNTVRSRLQEIGDLIHAAPQVKQQGVISFEFVVVTRADEQVFTAWRDDGLTYAPHIAEAIAARLPGEGEDDGAQSKTSATSIAPSNIVRVDLTKLDGLMQMIGELVISRSRLEENLAGLEATLPVTEWRALQEINLALEHQIRGLREGVMRVRMVPVGEIFERMKFVVRDLERETQKKIGLELSGQETEIDKLLVERMMDPLLHLVRNAISHGIEPESDRVAAGKAAEGKIGLRAFTSGESVFIEVEDDGRGIDKERVAERARVLGLIDSEAILDTTAALNLICAPGFSTREEADRASGRGVGMAVVKKTVLEIGGSLELDTEVGRGTRFTIQLPLTLAIADALIVSAGGQRYAVPLSAVREALEIEPRMVTALENNEIILHRGGVLPLVRLARVFGLNEKFGRAFHVLVVGNGLSSVGIAVDKILGQREIVVRNISDPLIQVRGIAGATELGDGRAVLILDPSALLGSGRVKEYAR